MNNQISFLYFTIFCAIVFDTQDTKLSKAQDAVFTFTHTLFTALSTTDSSDSPKTD
ncbi:MAG: hypothetical protein ACOZBL_03780 [Patescibacteria group bacterium]